MPTEDAMGHFRGYTLGAPAGGTAGGTAAQYKGCAEDELCGQGLQEPRLQLRLLRQHSHGLAAVANAPPVDTEGPPQDRGIAPHDLQPQGVYRSGSGLQVFGVGAAAKDGGRGEGEVGLGITFA